jgi:hypothetical protein
VDDPPRFAITYAPQPLSRASAAAVTDVLMQAHRRLGVSVRTGETTYEVRFVVEAPDADAARARASQALRDALVAAGQPVAGRADLAPVEVERVEPSPGAPRRVGGLPPQLPVRAVTLPSGAVLRATCEGGLGDWTVQLDDEQAWSGRSLPGVLGEALDLEDHDDPHMEQALRELAGRRIEGRWRFACPCCEEPTLDEPPPGTYDICERCGWEDDGVEYRGGANGESLLEARARWGPHRVSKAGRRRRR